MARASCCYATQPLKADGLLNYFKIFGHFCTGVSLVRHKALVYIYLLHPPEPHPQPLLTGASIPVAETGTTSITPKPSAAA